MIQITEKQRDEGIELLAEIYAYRSHLSGCAHWTEQTSEYCSCGLSSVREKCLKLVSILKGQ